MRHARRLFLGLAPLALTATVSSVAVAQTLPPTRYLSWASRGETAQSAPTAGDQLSQPAAPQPRPNRIIPHGGAYNRAPAPPAVSPEAPQRALTPANAWLRPAAVPLPTPAPVMPAALVPAAPEYLAERGRAGQPSPAHIALTSPAAPAPAPAVASAPASDPMAPRRDAPIFRMQQSAPPAQNLPSPTGEPPRAASEPRPAAIVTSNAADRPDAQGARYYSVHRQAGRQPDVMSLPEGTYIDGLAITAPITIASQDLAQPDQGPTLIRDAQGRVRAQPTTPDGDYQ